jgi:hypothetical protein
VLGGGTLGIDAGGTDAGDGRALGAVVSLDGIGGADTSAVDTLAAEAPDADARDAVVSGGNASGAGAADGGGTDAATSTARRSGTDEAEVGVASGSVIAKVPAWRPAWVSRRAARAAMAGYL